MENQEQISLSKKRYAIARVINYIQLLIFILILFLPTVSFTSHSEKYSIGATSSISVFQFLIGDTATPLHIDGGSSFLESLAGNISVDVPREMLGAELLGGFRVAVLVMGLFVGLISSLSNKMNSKILARNEGNSMRANLADHMYVTQVYTSLPKILSFFQNFIFAVTLGTYMFFFSGKIAMSKMDPPKTDWSFDILSPIFVVIIMILLVNGAIIHIVCAKDIAAIRTTGLRFEESYELPTISSDIKVIGSLFNKDFSKAPNSEDSKIEALQKYKALFDQGIITEEEFTKKKDEILNQQNDKR